MTAAQIVPLLAVLPVLMASAASDLRHLRIPNTHVFAILAIFVISAPFVLTWPEAGLRLAAAGIAFAIGVILFALGLFGGGDVKAMAAVMLLVPSGHVALLLQLFSAALLLTTLGVIALQRLPQAQRLGWESRRHVGHVPVGVAIAGGIGLLLLFG